MKIRAMVDHEGRVYPADHQAAEQWKKLKPGVLELDFKQSQNIKLHRKIFAFSKFCASYYYGTQEADLSQDQIDLVRKKLTIVAGYYKQVFLRDGERFELIPQSISYAKMSPEEREVFYSKMIDAAIKKVFSKDTDQKIIDRLTGFF